MRTSTAPGRLLALDLHLLASSTTAPSFRPRLTTTTPRTTFSSSSSASISSHHTDRPQLPFLTVPRRRQQWRLMTTESKARYKAEFREGMRLSSYILGLAAAGLALKFILDQEGLEQKYPTPDEWWFRTRMALREAQFERDRGDRPLPHWVAIVQGLMKVRERLHDPKVDGKGARDQTSGGGGEGAATGKDISAMPERWRRGYFQAMMLLAQAAGEVEGWAVDLTRSVCFPPEMVMGPSNANPTPIPPWAKKAPREENCVPANFPDPKELYEALMTTKGFTMEQHMEIALAYAAWADFKGDAQSAKSLHEKALLYATEDAYLGNKSYSQETPTANVVKALTAQAEFQARQGDTESALPVLTSLLRYRRSLSDPLPTPLRQKPDMSPSALLQKLFTPPVYPPVSDAGAKPPLRNSAGLCEEAALQLHIGEILYTLHTSTREEGLSWTREAVDLAEEELHKIEASGFGDMLKMKPVKARCRECLAAGLGNWATMAGRLAVEESLKMGQSKTDSTGSRWLNLWGSGGDADGQAAENGRWAAEIALVKTRTSRAQEVLNQGEKPEPHFLWTFFTT